MATETPRRSHAAQNAVDPRQFTREQLREFLRSVPTVSVEQAGACLSLSRPAAYRAAAAGQIKCLSLGRRRVVPTVWLEHVLMLNEECSAAVCETAAPCSAGSNPSLCPREAHGPRAEGEDA
jgi:hypothetical protein